METPEPTSSRVVLVDLHDRPAGDMEKMEAHRRGLLHRAVSVFLFNIHGEWLLQRRALSKYHSAGLWSNACCTHPYPGEAPAEAAQRRLGEELGLHCPLRKLMDFVYKSPLGNGLTEYEYDHIYIGYPEELPRINPDEVKEWGYFSTALLSVDIQAHPESYTVWFRHLYPEVWKRR